MVECWEVCVGELADWWNISRYIWNSWILRSKYFEYN